MWNLIALANDHPGWTMVASLAFAASFGALVARVRFLGKEIKGVLDQLNIRVDDIWKAIPKPAYSPGSPLMLNKIGKEISEKVSAVQIAKDYYGKVELPPNVNAYQIQVACFNYANEKLEKDAPAELLDQLEQYAFDSGHVKETVLGVIAIEMRDIILNERNMTHREIDTHDPAEKSE